MPYTQQHMEHSVDTRGRLEAEVNKLYIRLTVKGMDKDPRSYKNKLRMS